VIRGFVGLGLSFGVRLAHKTMKSKSRMRVLRLVEHAKKEVERTNEIASMCPSRQLQSSKPLSKNHVRFSKYLKDARIQEISGDRVIEREYKKRGILRRSRSISSDF
jgi:hypothetical protein